MTDLVNSITVVLAKNVREDDVEDLIKAIRCFSGVIDAKPNVSDIHSLVAESRAKSLLLGKLLEVLREGVKDQA